MSDNEVVVQQIFNQVQVSTPGPQGPAGDPSSLVEKIQGGYIFPDRATPIAAVTVAAGQARGSSFWAPESISINAIGFSTTGTLLQTNSTDLRFFIASMDPDTALCTVLGFTANLAADTLKIANTHYVRPLTSAVPMTKGLRYAIMVWQDGGASFNVAAASVAATGGGAINAIPPLLSPVANFTGSITSPFTPGVSGFAPFASFYGGATTLEVLEPLIV